jgi:glucose/arabinose dehydrogenase
VIKEPRLNSARSARGLTGSTSNLSRHKEKPMQLKIATLITLPFFLLCNSVMSQDKESPSVDRHDLQGEHGAYVVERVASGLSQPSAIEFLPDGSALIIQRNLGKITRIDFKSGQKTDITGLPKMVVYEDAGAHDIELHPDYQNNGWIYISYSEGEKVHSTVVFDRIKLEGTSVSERHRVF